MDIRFVRNIDAVDEDIVDIMMAVGSLVWALASCIVSYREYRIISNAPLFSVGELLKASNKFIPTVAMVTGSLVKTMSGIELHSPLSDTKIGPEVEPKALEDVSEEETRGIKVGDIRRLVCTVADFYPYGNTTWLTSSWLDFGVGATSLMQVLATKACIFGKVTFDPNKGFQIAQPGTGLRYLLSSSGPDLIRDTRSTFHHNLQFSILTSLYLLYLLRQFHRRSPIVEFIQHLRNGFRSNEPTGFGDGGLSPGEVVAYNNSNRTRPVQNNINNAINNGDGTPQQNQ